MARENLDRVSGHNVAAISKSESDAETLRRWLRCWRDDVAHLAVAEVASQLHVVPSALSNWESGYRQPDEEVIVRLDRIYKAGGALQGMAEALGSTKGLLPRKVWSYRFGAGGPVWVWIRPSSDEIRVAAQLNWGPICSRAHWVSDDRGVILTFPASVSFPALRVELSTEGWVDFGTGEIPADLGIPVTSLAAQKSTSEDAFRGLHSSTASGLVTETKLNTERWVQRTNPGMVSVRDLTKAILPVNGKVSQYSSGKRYQLLRQARSLTQRKAAAMATSLLPEHPVSDDQIRTLEKGGNPQVQHLFSRLDMIYKGYGTTLIERIPITANSRGMVVRRPSKWKGPTWLRFSGPRGDSTGHVILRWDRWCQLLHVRTGVVVSDFSTQSDIEDLVVSLPVGWRMEAGIGVYPSAADISNGWCAVDESGASSMHSQMLALSSALEGIQKSNGHSSEDDQEMEGELAVLAW